MMTPNQVAEYYGLPLHQFRQDIRDSLKQSKENAGRYGKSRWHYFDGYMSDTAAFVAADSKAARAFERAAY